MEKVSLHLLLVGLVSVALALEPPHGSVYIGGFLCPLSDPPEGAAPGCDASCGEVSRCDVDGEQCCPTTPGCRECREAIPTDSMNCENDDGIVSPLTTTFDQDECVLCVCVAGEFYCHDIEGDCTNITQPTEGGSCSYGDRRIQPGELTLISQGGRDEEDEEMDEEEEEEEEETNGREEEECKICICGNGVLFCRTTDICRPNVTCEYGGEEMVVGESVTSDNECTSCTCTESGEVECSTSDECTLCEYNGEELEVGETVSSTDGCNECTCTSDGDVACTERACIDRCSQEMDAGPCEAIFPSWFYNSESGECEMFNYGGCQGNQNRFETEQDCQMACDEDACPDGGVPVACEVDLCEDLECDAVEEAECSIDNCRGCRPMWHVGEEDVTEQCDTGCPEGLPLVSCFADPCDVSRCDVDGAECVSNYCGGCNAVWLLEDREVCRREPECPDDEEVVECSDSPCDVATCPAFPSAYCVNYNCGSCRPKFYVGDEDVTDSCEGDCDEGEVSVLCLRRPCDGAVCPAMPEATCRDDYCGGCNTHWMLEGEDVTERCTAPTGAFEPSHSPSCPAVELDTCEEECEGDESCPESQLCCRGCGSSCQVPVNLPFYDVPLACPPQVISLASDSATCDLQCHSDTQCHGDKICCRYGCSSSCQDGFVPPEPCNNVRELLEGDRDDEDDDSEESEVNGEEEDEEAGDEDRPLLGQFVPSCLPEGYFNPVQVWENNRWCVNVVTGKPIGSAYAITSNLNFSCPSCTHDERVFYAGQTFYDDCNTCRCTENGLAACTRRACLDPCHLPASAGTCEDRVTQYFFNSESRQCETFVYSGCGGNSNRFSSATDCLRACRPNSVCLLDWDEGEPCNDDDDETTRGGYYYYYDAEEGECDSDRAYECGGNANRFQNGLDCLNTCDPSNPGPTDIYGNPCWEIQCDIPFCGEGVEVVYSDMHCCPFCEPDDEEECDDNEFRCQNGECIPGARVCDGLSDCSDRSDEGDDDECSVDIVPCEYQCSDEQCIPESYVCDGVLDCDNAMDEHDCEDEFVPGAPFYPPPPECPEASDVLGPCDIGECVMDAECEGARLCCPNNCNQRMCVEPLAASPACEAIVERLSINVSYIPQCLPSGDYRPLQCSGVSDDDRMCWCVNVISGVPYTSTYNDRYPECDRCTYNGESYTPGERYTAEDGCNTCVCVVNGESLCTRTACVPEECEIGDITVDHGETRALDCQSCSCFYGEINCTRRDCAAIELLREAVLVEMTFDGDFSDLTAEEGAEEELAREVERTLLRRYRSSMELDEDQVVVTEVREGSVIVVVELEDNEDQTGANITILVYQLERDYNDGTLIIRFNNTALVPSGEFVVNTIIDEEEEDDGFEFVWWYGLVIAVVVVGALLLVLVLAIMMFAFCRKRSSAVHVDKLNGNEYTDTVEMRKVPLDEKA